MNGRLGRTMTLGVLVTATLMSGCSAPVSEEAQAPPSESHRDPDDHEGHDHPADGGPAPEGMTERDEPRYPVGAEVILTADHMAGMDGATATIVGAYETYTYSVDYTPTTGGDPVEDHRWVVQEEIRDAGGDLLPDGTEVTLAAEHMTGMDGATATIASSTGETVYIVDLEVDGMTMTNHKWVVESEIEPAS
ncbi:YdhK family protein [Actinotalea sp. BY-33]|uniref:YdhK family protein n=1 Tax=Actinotalea soli TaxID=2819234 RepID=A0A939LMY2_9CELL|nr:YdhK family protein [Actinotalea soli]MBO1750223.1 YdhK family protein [Actinotalea soli]